MCVQKGQHRVRLSAATEGLRGSGEISSGDEGWVGMGSLGGTFAAREPAAAAAWPYQPLSHVLWVHQSSGCSPPSLCAP